MQNRFARKTLLAVLIILVFAIFATRRAKSSSIVIADASHPAFALLYIADKKGFFEEEKLKVSYEKFSIGRDALESVTQGKSDLATVYETPVVRKIYEGEDLAILTTLHTSSDYTALIGWKEKGINSAADLSGKRIGVPKGTNAEFFLVSLFGENNIKMEESNIEYLEIDDLLSAFKEKRLDAIAIFNPYLYNLKKEYSQELITIKNESYTEVSTLVGKADYVKNNKKEIIKLLRALRKAESFARENPEESANLVSNWLLLENSSFVKDIWPDFERKLGLDNTLVSIMEREARYLKLQEQHGKELPKFREYMYTEYLQEVYPEVVTLN